MKVFISHASEDKDHVARPLAEYLTERRIDVWYDEYSLKPGDSLRESIDKGISTCDYGAVILSHAFFSKRWPKSELDAIFGMDLESDRRFIFPIWHQITAKEVMKYSPMVASRVALDSSVGINEIVEQFLSIAISDEQQLEQKNEQCFRRLNRYYNPPDEIPKKGYLLEPGTYNELCSQMRPRELLMAYGNPRGQYKTAGHVTSEERMMEFEYSWWIAPAYYAVEYSKVMDGFDEKLNHEEIVHLESGKVCV